MQYQASAFFKEEAPCPSLLKGMYALRHEVFHSTLGWVDAAPDGLDVDLFDTGLNPIYVLCQGEGGRMLGCLRALPTTGSNMLSDVFPELLRGEKLPQSPHVWEISRLATVMNSRKGQLDPQISLCEVTLSMFRHGYGFGREHGVKDLVFVTSVAVERMLVRTGMVLRRFGDGVATKIGNTLSVACWLEDVPENRRIFSPMEKEKERAA